MISYHYTNRMNEIIGPVEEHDLASLFNNGDIESATQILAEGSDTWNLYSELQGGTIPPSNSPPQA